MWTWVFDEVASGLPLERAMADYGYWWAEGSIELKSYCYKSSNSPSSSFGPSLSQPITLRLRGEPEPSCPSSRSPVRTPKRKHWTAQCGGASFGILQVLFFKPKLCKSPTTPFVTPPLLPCVKTPPRQVPTLALWAAHPSMLPPSVKKKRWFPTIPWWHGQCFPHLIDNTTRGGGGGGSCSLTQSYTFCFGLCPPVNIWSCVQEACIKGRD